MSQEAEHCLTLADMLKKYPKHGLIVLEVFYSTVTNQEWSDSTIAKMLSFGLGLSDDNTNNELLRLIDMHKEWSKSET